jgi:DNA-binding NarL/FixJ family response regulator
MPRHKIGKIALVVDDVPFVCRMLSRVLAEHFDGVLTASNPGEAEEHLATGAVTHVLCNCKAGPGETFDVERVADCRRRHPRIERVVVFVGEDAAGEVLPPEVDRALGRGASHEELLDALGVGRPSR